MDHGRNSELHWVEPQILRERESPRLVMVNRNHVADEVIHRVRNDGVTRENNLETVVKRIMARNEIIIGLHRPNYTSPLFEYILEAELPRRYKVPKFTKFSGDTID